MLIKQQLSSGAGSKQLFSFFLCRGAVGVHSWHAASQELSLVLKSVRPTHVKSFHVLPRSLNKHRKRGESVDTAACALWARCGLGARCAVLFGACFACGWGRGRSDLEKHDLDF